MDSKTIRVRGDTLERMTKWVATSEVFSTTPNDVIELLLDIADDLIYVIEHPK